MIVPSQDYRRTQIVAPEELNEGLDSLVNGVVGWYRRLPGFGRSLREDADKVADKVVSLRKLSDRRIRNNLNEYRMRFRRQERGFEQLISEALAFLVEAADRTLGLRPFPVQIMGAMGLYKNYLVEMATGEGKSLTACLSAVMAAWSGRPCHIVTVNDYLADRDAHEMRQFYSYCGVSAGCVTSQMPPEERHLNYEKGVVYTTSKELLADFLRDRIQLGLLHHPLRRLIRQILQPRLKDFEGIVMRGIDTAIVDEADSVLIDEAVTPLIISQANDNRPLVEACQKAYKIANMLKPDIDYNLDVKYREIRLKKDGTKKLDKLSGLLPGIWKGATRREELVKQALTAREFYLKDKQYVVENDKITIVDEFTGRLMPNRTWSHGLHQAVETKENVEVSSPTETLARLSFQRFFRLFRKLSGMTGTAREAASEFWHIYGLAVLPVPTNMPCIRKHFEDRVFPSEKKKWQAIADDIIKWHKTGRPLLVGTRSVRASEKLAAMLESIGLEFNLLNAVHHKQEARIVAAGGEMGKITIATNMAGRGTDIKLGRGVADIGGLHVIATERHESGRIDRQLFGRSGRQGDAGSAQAYISMDDELMQRFIPEPIRKRLVPAVEKKLAGAQWSAQKTLYLAQKGAQRLAFKQRKNVLQMDKWLEEALSFTGSTLQV